VSERKLDPVERYQEWKSGADGRRILALFERFALDAASIGQRFGFKGVAERVRWEIAVVRRSREDYKVDNAFVSMIARDLVAKHPALAGLVELRRGRWVNGRSTS